MEQRRTPIQFQFEAKPHILIIEGRYYNDVADLQLRGTEAVLERAKATYDKIVVPGAFDIPQVIAYSVKGMDFDATRRRFDGYVALGCVLKGATNHHLIIGQESTRALLDVAQRFTLAVGNGILTCDTREQALERADPARQDRSGEATEACLRMIQIKQQFNLTPKRRWVAR